MNHKPLTTEDALIFVIALGLILINLQRKHDSVRNEFKELCGRIESLEKKER